MDANKEAAIKELVLTYDKKRRCILCTDVPSARATYTILGFKVTNDPSLTPQQLTQHADAVAVVNGNQPLPSSVTRENDMIIIQLADLRWNEKKLAMPGMYLFWVYARTLDGQINGSVAFELTQEDIAAIAEGKKLQTAEMLRMIQADQAAVTEMLRNAAAERTKAESIQAAANEALRQANEEQAAADRAKLAAANTKEEARIEQEAADLARKNAAESMARAKHDQAAADAALQKAADTLANSVPKQEKADSALRAAEETLTTAGLYNAEANALITDANQKKELADQTELAAKNRARDAATSMHLSEAAFAQAEKRMSDAALRHKDADEAEANAAARKEKAEKAILAANRSEADALAAEKVAIMIAQRVEKINRESQIKHRRTWGYVTGIIVALGFFALLAFMVFMVHHSNIH